MRHVIFALFDSDQAAEACVSAIRAQPGLCGECTILMHHGRVRTAEAPIEETSARSGAVTGGLIGGALCGVMGALLFGPLGLVGAGPLAGALFGLFGGGALGALGGGLTGAAEPDPTLEDVRRDLEAGKVLLTVEPMNYADTDDLERICVASGGRIARKQVLGYGPIDAENPNKKRTAA